MLTLEMQHNAVNSVWQLGHIDKPKANKSEAEMSKFETKNAFFSEFKFSSKLLESRHHVKRLHRNETTENF